MTTEDQLTSVLQLVRLKGRVAPATVATSLGLAETDVATLLQTLKSAEAINEINGSFRLAPSGREQLAHRIEAQRCTLDQAALHAAYEAFHPLNNGFKQLVTDWQLRNGMANDHSDAGYDASIYTRLSQLDQQFASLLTQLVALVPRLRPYPARFANALQKLLAGDPAWLARPILDSYHTVWFELHEDLIGLLGLSREAEAVAGRAE